jgi:segregation and condensation protein A
MATAARKRAGHPSEAEREMAEIATAQPELIPYTVHLPGFDGPLDLLLHLIERNQLEITMISLVAVTDQFIAYLRTWDEPPMPRLAEFVAMAARLLLIKSRSLLPRQPRQDDGDETDPLDDAEQLRRHLIEYKLAREIAQHLRAREIAGLQSFARPGRMLVDPDALLTLTPPRLVGLNVQALAHVFRRVLTERRFSEPEKLPQPLITIAEMIAEVETLLATHASVPLEEVLFFTATSRFAVVVTFLAVLELWHQNRIVVQQEHLFGPIVLLRAPQPAAQRASVPEELDEQGEQVGAEDQQADHD